MHFFVTMLAILALLFPNFPTDFLFGMGESWYYHMIDDVPCADAAAFCLSVLSLPGPCIVPLSLFCLFLYSLHPLPPPFMATNDEVCVYFKILESVSTWG